MRTLLAAVLLSSSAALADPPSPEDMAVIQHDIDKATSDVDKKYSGKELSSDEKKQQIKERAAAERAVLEKKGVNGKDFARAQATMSKDDRAANKAAGAELEKKDKAAADAPKGGGKEIVIEKGGAGAEPKSDEDEAAAMDRAQGLGKSNSGGKKKGKR